MSAWRACEAVLQRDRQAAGECSAKQCGLRGFSGRFGEIALTAQVPRDPKDS